MNSLKTIGSDEEQLKVAFNFFDINTDGKITTDDLANILKIFHYNFTTSNLTDIIKELSGNTDYVDFDTFCTIFSSKSPKVESKKATNASSQFAPDLHTAFTSIFDRKGNNKVTVCELRSVLALFGEHLNDEEIDEMVRVIDTANDGVIDFNEFKQIMLM